MSNIHDEPNKAFVFQIVTVVHTCHSHNIAAGRKRLDSAVRLFLASRGLESGQAASVRAVVEKIADQISLLRVIDASNEEKVKSVRKAALDLAQRLYVFLSGGAPAELPQEFANDAYFAEGVAEAAVG